MSIQIQNPMNIVESMACYVGHILLFIYHNKDGGNCIKVSFFYTNRKLCGTIETCFGIF
jgi:hypothetical protein